MNKPEQDWKEKLSEEEYRILREAGTERPFSGEYNMHFEDGTYKCAGCDTPLFVSNTKFDSGCGWPSFDEAIEGNVTYKQDRKLGMLRTEILCTNCGGHLGHVFDDGPTDTGKRYCVNSLSLNFNSKNQTS
jgi:peptide-methionine (R)-S-oxide reductase